MVPSFDMMFPKEVEDKTGKVIAEFKLIISPEALFCGGAQHKSLLCPPCHMPEVLDSLLSISSDTWAFANKDQLSNERQL